jgi:D-inositol-3-phosphate glycosyltransferase
MRIALVCGHGPGSRLPLTDSGAHQARTDALAAALAALGHDVCVHRPARNGQRLDPAPSRTLGRVRDGRARHRPAAVSSSWDDGLAEALDFGAVLARAWSRRPPDLVHSLCRSALLAAAAGLGPRRSPLVQTVEAVAGPAEVDSGPGGDSFGHSLPQSGGWLAHGVVDGFLATSSQVIRDLTRAGVDPTVIRLVPWGVDPDVVCAQSPVGRPIERRPDEHPILLSVAGLHELDGADLLVRALPGIPSARLVLAAGPSPARLDHDLDAIRIRALAAACAVAGRVTLLGSIRWSELPCLLQAADLVVWAGWRQPAGVLPAEVMAAGVPVLATAVGGALDAIAHGLTGILVPPGRPETLAAAAGRLLAAPQRLQVLAEAALQSARSRNRWEQTAAGALVAYQAAINATDRRASVRQRPAAVAGLGRGERQPDDQPGDLADSLGPGLGS